jgi:energy-coupling factor transporter ATP-binding protein EcfA2
MTREVYWAGFGFQIWCQLLTHIHRASDTTLLIVDEPEVYLHPDVQRQLLNIVRNLGPCALLATHSTEIMAEADPSEIVIIDKSKRSGERLTDVKGVQVVLEQVGSIQNITLARLARNKRVLFLEGPTDYPLLMKFARKLGFEQLPASEQITPAESGGLANMDHLKSFSWFCGKLGAQLRVASVFDRDFLPDVEIAALILQLKEQLEFVHVHEQKELENYLLCIGALDRAIAQSAEERRTVVSLPLSAEILEEVTAPLKIDIQAQYLAKRRQYLATKGRRDHATIDAETLTWFENNWSELDCRLKIVPGKRVLQSFRSAVQDRFAITLTDYRIVIALREKEIPKDLRNLIAQMDRFRES